MKKVIRWLFGCDQRDLIRDFVQAVSQAPDLILLNKYAQMFLDMSISGITNRQSIMCTKAIQTRMSELAGV